MVASWPDLTKFSSVRVLLALGGNAMTNAEGEVEILLARSMQAEPVPFEPAEPED